MCIRQTDLKSRNNLTADFLTVIELADDTTALLIYCHACHARIRLLIFCVVTQQAVTFWGVGTQAWGLWPSYLN